MTAENFFINKSRNWKAVEAVGERLPQLDGKPTLT